MRGVSGNRDLYRDYVIGGKGRASMRANFGRMYNAHVKIFERVEMMSVTDFKAAQKWAKLPKQTKQLILENVLCSSCGVTTIVEFTMQDTKFGILLKGKCVKCGRDVARLLENE